MFENNAKIEMGNIKIQDRVLTSIAAIAAKQVEGVVDTKTCFLDPLFHFFVKQWPLDGVKVVIMEQEVIVTLHAILKYGVDIPRIAAAIQKKVKTAIEEMTGLSSVEVNVVVQKIVAEKGRDV